MQNIVQTKKKGMPKQSLVEFQDKLDRDPQLAI